MKIYWDIDGTLINSKQANVNAFFELHNTKDKKRLPSVSQWGRTDEYYCWQNYIASHGRVPNRAELHCYCSKYESYIIEYFKENLVSVDNEIRCLLASQNGIEHLICTGNRRKGAWKKLVYLEIAHYFNWEDSYFGDGYVSKYSMVKSYYKERGKLQKKSNKTQQSVDLYVGDTVIDMRCGKAMGLYTVGLCLNPYDEKAFEKNGADFLIKERKNLAFCIKRIIEKYKYNSK